MTSACEEIGEILGGGWLLPPAAPCFVKRLPPQRGGAGDRASGDKPARLRIRLIAEGAFSRRPAGDMEERYAQRQASI